MDKFRVRAERAELEHRVGAIKDKDYFGSIVDAFDSFAQYLPTVDGEELCVSDLTNEQILEAYERYLRTVCAVCYAPVMEGSHWHCESHATISAL